MIHRIVEVSKRLCLLTSFFLSAYPVSGLTIDQSDSSRTALNRLDRFYQEQIGAKTIHRCPFQTSCSQFLIQSVEKQGAFKGTLLFLDRFFFRENASVKDLYEALERDNRVIFNDNISDSLFIYLYSD